MVLLPNLYLTIRNVYVILFIESEGGDYMYIEADAPMTPREEREVWESMFPSLSDDEIFDLVCEREPFGAE